MSGSRKPADRGRKVASPPETMSIAMSLAAIGWPVFPVTIYEDENGKRSKVPAVKWKDWATADVKTVAKAWAGEHSGRWIGVYAEKAGIVTLDVDPGGDAEIAQHGHEIPETFNYPTHRPGGRHHVYAAPEGIELTIVGGLFGKGSKVDVRAGSGLMIYYGPALTKRPKLAPAPDWILARRGESRAGSHGADYSDRGANADETAYRARLTPGTPDKVVREALKAVKSKGMDHDAMLAAVTELVGLGTRGHRGVGEALDVARETYSAGWPDAARHWDNAVAGSVRRLGLPPVTLDLSKPERKAIKARNDPKAVEARTAERKGAYRAEKHRGAMQAAQGGDARPLPGERILEDASLAEELAHMLRGRWAYTPGLGIMRYVKSGRAGRWKPAEEHSLIEAVRKLLVDIEVDEHAAAAMRGDNKAIDKARTLLARGRAAAVARFVLGILAEDEPTFDDHPDLLNTPSGVVDLTTGKLTKADPLLFLSKMTAAPYDPDADMRQWRRALEAVPAKIRPWLQVRFGQAATGYTPTDATMLIFEGAGSNGKSTIVTAPVTALGEYATALPERLLLANPGDHPTTLMTLMGARLGVIEELPEGHSLNVKRLKDTVGTPRITARKMRQDDVTFRATHCLMVNTNYLPIVVETDHGTWRRLALVRFPLKFVETKGEIVGARDRLGDPTLIAYFEETADPGVLRWIVEGAVAWYANGKRFSKRPKKIIRDTRAWRMDADPILAYVDERLTRDEGYAITTADLAADFNGWLERRGHKPWSQQTINSRFQGHVSMDGISRKQGGFGLKVRASRPRNLFGVPRAIPRVTMSWRGVRFADEEAVLSEAELDAATLSDLERRAQA